MQNPQSGDVLQQVHTAVHAALVGESGTPGFGGKDGVGEVHTEERPGAAAEECRGGSLGDRDGCRERGTLGVVAAHGNDFHIVGERKFNGHFRKYASALFAGHHNGREHLRPQTETLDKGNVPSTAAGIEEFRSGGDGILAAGTAAEIEAEEVGHEQKTLRCLHEFRLFAEHGLQLVDGVDVHHLHACLGIVGIGIVRLHEGFAQPFGAAVAVAYGETD